MGARTAYAPVHVVRDADPVSPPKQRPSTAFGALPASGTTAAAPRSPAPRGFAGTSLVYGNRRQGLLSLRRMRGLIRLVVLLLVAFAVLIAPSPAVAQKPRAERPTYQLGDKWILNDGAYELIRVEKDRYVFAASPDRQIHLTKNLGLAKLQRGAEVMEFTAPPEPTWPLEVGRGGWVTTALRNAQSQPWASRTRQVTWGVEAYEDINGPEGLVKAFHISYRSLVSSRSESGPALSLDVWYEPKSQHLARLRGLLYGSAFDLVMVGQPHTAPLEVAVEASAQNTPLPVNLKIESPDSRIPPEVAAFSGQWVGKWEGVLDSTLVVTKIYAERAAYKANIIYSNGVYIPWNILAPGYREYTGAIKDGTLTIQRGRIIMMYKLSPDRSTLDGTYDNAGRQYPGTFTIVKWAVRDTDQQPVVAGTPPRSSASLVSTPPAEVGLHILGPAGSTVTIDGDRAVVVLDAEGKASVSLPPGEHRLHASRDGFVPQGTIVKLESGIGATHRISLSPLVPPAVVAVSPKSSNVIRDAEVPLATRVVPPPLAGERLAVVVGIGAYDYATIPRLPYAARDAEAIYEVLTTRAGFKKENVILLTDGTSQRPTLRNIKSALGTFLARSAKQEDTVIVFFAGHGAPELDRRGMERDGLAKYLIPSDADPNDLYATALSMDEIQTIFGRIDAERLVMFVDSCYSGAAGGRTFASQRVRTRDITIDDQFLDRLTRVKGRAIITAARSSEVSLELSELGHGLFTYYLVEALRGAADANKDGVITPQELYDYVARQVAAKSRSVGGSQHPVMKGELEGPLPLVRLPR